MTVYEGIKEIQAYCKDYEPRLDPILSMQLNRPIFDAFDFDDYLHEKFGEYEKEGKSMKDLLLEKYGEEAVKRIENLFLMEDVTQ